MKKILLINEYLSDNIGDVAIGETIKKYCEIKGYSVTCADYTKEYKVNIQTEKNLNKVMKCKETIFTKLKFNIKKLFPIVKTIVWFKNNKSIFLNRKHEKYDKVIIGGGQLLLSNGYFVLSLLLWFLMSKIYFKSEVYLYGVGVGDKISLLDSIIFKIILPKFDGIYIRDRDSINKLSKIINKNLMVLSPDIVYYYGKLYKKNIEQKDNILLVGVMDYTTINSICRRYNSEIEYMEEWISLIKENNDNKTVNLIYNTEADRIQTYRFKEYCLQKYNLDYKVIDTRTLDKLIQILVRSNTVISARMHAMIIAKNFECNVIPFVFSDKLASFKNEVENNFNIDEIRKNIEINMNRILEV